MIIESIDGLLDEPHTVCVVGSGPVGITVALELARLGQHVTLIESGSLTPDVFAQGLSEAERVDPRRNTDMALAVQRSFGGTSNLWGAGCVPLDPVDFEPRAITGNAPWPVSYADFAEHLPAACRYANCGHVFEQELSGVDAADQRFSVSHLMRYADPPRFQKAYASEIASSQRITLHLGVTVTGLRHTENGALGAISVRGRDGRSGLVRAKAFILACGGVETTRLLLSAQADAPGLYGGEDGPLGSYYMGHLSGAIADIRFKDDALDKGFDFFRLDDEYARRRLTASAHFQQAQALSNISFWPTLPAMHDPHHRDPVLSLAYLVLSMPPLGRRVVSESLRRINVGEGGNHLAHLRNVGAGLPGLAITLPRFLHGRFLARNRLPGLHLRNGAKRYVLHYHAEHLPNAQSRIRLSDQRDAMGMRRAILDLRFTTADADPILRTHEHLARWLVDSGLGELIWHHPPSERLDRVLDLAGDGVHQIGTLRMGMSSRHGVVDSDCRVFGAANLFIAGSAVFPTSGQANPTLSALALGVRTAGRLASEITSHEIVQGRVAHPA